MYVRYGKAVAHLLFALFASALHAAPSDSLDFSKAWADSSAHAAAPTNNAVPIAPIPPVPNNAAAIPANDTATAATATPAPANDTATAATATPAPANDTATAATATPAPANDTATADTATVATANDTAADTDTAAPVNNTAVTPPDTLARPYRRPRPRPTASPPPEYAPAQTPFGTPAQPAQTPPSRPRTQEELGRMSREELFRLAFGRAAPERSRNMMMRLFAEGRTFGNTEIVYDANFSAFDFRSPPLSNFLDKTLLPEARAKAGDSTGFFNSAVLRAAGYELSADELKFELRVTVPPEDKAVQRTYLNGYYESQPEGEEVKPAKVSFYANYRLDERMRYSDYSQTVWRDTLRRDPAFFDFDGAMAVFGWVLEGSGYIRESGNEGESFTRESFERGDLRLVRDIVPWQSRMSAGDVWVSSDILGGEALGGVRFERNGWFFGNDPRAKQNMVRFFMVKAGWVEVYVNGAYSRRIYLPAGHHEVGGFGGDVGRNSVLLVLRADDGGIEEIPFDYVLEDPRAMRRGDARWSATAGMQRVYDAALPPIMRYRYMVGAPAAHADVYYGLLNWLSVGAAAQGSERNGSAGAQFLMDLGGFGWVDMRGFVSGAGYERLGGRAALSYTARLQPAVAWLNGLLTGGGGREVLPRMSLSARGYWQSPDYRASLFSPYTGPQAGLAGASGDLGMSMSRVNVTATGGLNFVSDTAKYRNYGLSGYTYGGRLAFSVNTASFSVSAGDNVTAGGHTPYFNVGTNYALGFRVRNHRFSVSTGAGMRRVDVPQSVSRDDTVPAHSEDRWSYGGSAGWRWSNNGSGTGAQAYSASVGLRSDGVPVYGANAQYTHNRAQLTMNYGLAPYEGNAYKEVSHDVRAQLTGSFMFADGLFAFGRQVSNGFVLISPWGNMRGAKVHVDRSHYFRQDFSRNGWLGAAYQNRLMDYRPTQLMLTLTDLKPGAFWEQGRYYATGAYRQGYALRIGAEAQVMLLARFMDGGRPLGYAYVTVEPEEGWSAGGADARERRATFTGGDGVLQIGGLAPGGSYRIKFSSSTYLKDVIIDVPKHADPIMELPDIEVERE